MPATTDYPAFNFTDGALHTTTSWWCFVLPFCNTSDCDMTKVHNPVSCQGCNAGIVALLFVILLIMSIFIVLGNTGILIVIMKNPIFHNPFNMFKCSLAVADLLVGLVVIPSGVVETVVILIAPFDKEEVNSSNFILSGSGELVKPGSVCARIHREEHSSAGFFLSTMGVLSIMSSIFNLVLLSIDRFLAVRCPIKYNQGRAINIRMAWFLILIVWVTCIILSAVVPVTMGSKYFRFGLTSAMIFTLKTMNSHAGFFYALFAIGFPYLLLVSLNVGTGVLLFRKRKKITKRTVNNPVAANGHATHHNGKRSNEVKATVTLLLMVVIFTVSTIPALILVTMFNDRRSNNQYVDGYSEGTAYLILILLLVSNSAWNFIIYSWRNENFRKALKRLLMSAAVKGQQARWQKVKSVTFRKGDKKKRRNDMGEAARMNVNSAEERKIDISSVDLKIAVVGTPEKNTQKMVSCRSSQIMTSASSSSSLSNGFSSEEATVTSVIESEDVKSPAYLKEEESLRPKESGWTESEQSKADPSKSEP